MPLLIYVCNDGVIFMLYPLNEITSKNLPIARTISDLKVCYRLKDEPIINEFINYI